MIGNGDGTVGDDRTGTTSVSGPLSTEPSEKRVSLSVVESVAAASGVAPADIETPLYEAVDPDALDDLFSPAGGSPASGFVVFTYAGHEVTVTADGEVDVVPNE